jgi:hypothetical protein
LWDVRRIGIWLTPQMIDHNALLRGGGSSASEPTTLRLTGNGGDIERRQYPDELYLPDHLVFAGRKHVELFLQRAGFSTVMIEQQRIDATSSLAKRVIKSVLKRHPMFSPFRTVFFKAQRTEK